MCEETKHAEAIVEGHDHGPLSCQVLTVIPGKAAFRFEKHRIDRLGLEFAVQHQERRIVGCEFRADLFAIGRGFGIGLPGRNREARQNRA